MAGLQSANRMPVSARTGKEATPIHGAPQAESAIAAQHKQAQCLDTQGNTLAHNGKGSHSRRIEAPNRKVQTNMGKVLVILLATFACLAILVHFVGGQTMGSTALNVPGTAHTPAFGLTWTIVLGACIGYGVYRIVKGK